MCDTPEKIIKELNDHNVVVEFTKKSTGEIRVLEAVKWRDIPDFKEDYIPQEVTSGDLVKVYELGKGWRSFYLNNVVSYKVVDDASTTTDN